MGICEEEARCCRLYSRASSNGLLTGDQESATFYECWRANDMSTAPPLMIQCLGFIARLSQSYSAED